MSEYVNITPSSCLRFHWAAKVVEEEERGDTLRARQSRGLGKEAVLRASEDRLAYLKLKLKAV